MTSPRVRIAAAGALVLAAALSIPAASASADPSAPPGRSARVPIQLLSFNDYHGHLEATDPALPSKWDPSQSPTGGVEYLSATIKALRAEVGDSNSLTVAAGDLIGGSPFLSGMFHDEPSVESLETLGLDVSSVGNHEFDEGSAELLRMQHGGCHPEDGCYFPEQPYDGASFTWLAANVVKKSNGKPLLAPVAVRAVKGVQIGFIGMTLEATPTLVNPAGVASVDFKDEIETANAQAAALKKRGVNTIVVLIHEGGVNPSGINSCTGVSNPILAIAQGITHDVDAIITGHTHEPYICQIPDAGGVPRLVTSAASYGQVVTETTLVVDKATGEVDRSASVAENHLVLRSIGKDPAETAVIAKWNTLAAPMAARIVGSHVEDILGDSNGNRGIETPMADLVADAWLYGTASAANGGAQIAFQNVGGTRASFRVNSTPNGEQPGQITYAEAYTVVPFSNVMVTIDLTGDQLRQALEQQFVPTRGRQYLALGVSAGFSYAWDALAPQGSKVVPGSMTLNGVPMLPTATYRVALPNFLADGGDDFLAFKAGTNRLGGGEDLAMLVSYLQSHPGLTAPGSRVDGL
ncbi:MAG: bifunctional metallophosphatase/5'-nucleotidase [Actinomycetales bacterium]|uniref:Bifunctional metallophosphatase/5'-nucleotidase n=1 Tax=Candidatus Phosphoribacter hodrii TaxID=2953743 RepID=A0A9D7XUR7_9MICO|nr:bifunctional metallophosphatase/5'-nucleotidase [Candidatus Phosphoribacter hodrii]